MTTHTATGTGNRVNATIPMPHYGAIIDKPHLSYDDYRLIADAYIGSPEDDLLEAKRETIRNQYGVDEVANALLRRYSAHNSLIELHCELADQAIQALSDIFVKRG